MPIAWNLHDPSWIDREYLLMLAHMSERLPIILTDGKERVMD
jgi:hypothetical protein